MTLSFIPLLASLHFNYPSYNAVSVRDVVEAFEPDALVLSPLSKGCFATAEWQDTPEVVLPLSVVPWAKKRHLPLYPIYEPSQDEQAPNDFRNYARQYAQLSANFSRIDALKRPLEGLLRETLSLARILHEVLPLIKEHQQALEAAFEDGPATNWLRARLNTMADRILALPHERLAVLASVEHIPLLQEALEGKAKELDPPHVAPSEASRERSLLDFAFRTDVPEPGNVIAQLKTLNYSEARYHEANLLLANGHVVEALEVLEELSKGNFSEPYFLPAYALARLGQLYDLLGKRDAALRAYRGVRALSYAPKDALMSANKGLEAPFNTNAG